MLKTPVVVIIFNRPDRTTESFSRIRDAKPTRLFVIADGPRSGKDNEAQRCLAAREAVLSGIDWPCDVRTRFSETNQGCRTTISSGLDWVFSQCERAIIIEDDCVVDLTFFRFCDTLLDRYQDDPRVMHIAGFNPLGDVTDEVGRADYFFSRYMFCWGWATWANRWRQWTSAMATWQQHSSRLWDVAPSPVVARFFSYRMRDITRGRISSWAYQWQVACLLARGTCIVPARNMVRNVGFGNEGTHTKGDDPYAALPVSSCDGDMRHPTRLDPDPIRDDALFHRVHTSETMERLLIEQAFWAAWTSENMTVAVQTWTEYFALQPWSIHTYRMAYAIAKRVVG